MIFVDVETQSACDIRCGGVVYAHHPTTRVMSVVAYDDEAKFWRIWIPRSVSPRGIDEIDLTDILPRGNYVIDTDDEYSYLPRDVTYVAHNADGFDRWIFEVKFNAHREWIDTIPYVRSLGLPGSLGECCRHLFSVDKDDSDAMKMLSKVKIVAGKPVYPIGTLPLWQDMIRYNVKDVILLYNLYNYCVKYDLKYGEIKLDQKINRKGIRLNIPLIIKLKQFYHVNRIEAGEKLKQITNGELNLDNVNSVKSVKKYLKNCGLQLTSLDRRVVDQILVENYDEKILEVLRLRQEIVRSASAKLDKSLEIQHKGFCYNQLVYHGALSGRFAGRGLQIQNFPRGNKDVDVEKCLNGNYDTVRMEAEKCKIQTSDVLATLLRSIIIPRENCKFAIADFAAIEARGVAWIADEQILLEKFRDPNEDVYVDMAMRLWDCDRDDVTKERRFIAKQIVLGCGYQMSWMKFEALCKIFNVDLIQAGTDARICVNLYRHTFKKIAERNNGIWFRFQNAAHEVINTRSEITVGKCTFFYDAGNFCIELPSKRILTYRNAFIEDRVPGYAKHSSGPARQIPTIIFRKPTGNEGVLYGGLITENVVQAISRDLLCHALQQCEEQNLNPLFHVHDEVVCEVKAEYVNECLRKLCKIMSTPPEWAEGFPLAVEGFTSDYYTKNPQKGATHERAHTMG